MDVGIYEQRPDAGEIKGVQEPVACGVWFTSTGRAIPKAVKFQDAEGQLHMLKEIQVLSWEEKYYCGIPSVEYECETAEGQKRIPFRLLFYPERREWKILWKERERHLHLTGAVK